MNRDRNIEYKYTPPRRSYKIPKQSWVQRNPRLFAYLLGGTSLLIFFSRPLYDAFLRPESEFAQPDPKRKIFR